MIDVDLNAFEFERKNIFKRLQIVKFLAIAEALVVLYLAFMLSKDLIIALSIAVFVGVIFYRLLSAKLLTRKNDIENELLKHFLAQHNAEFKGTSLDEANCKKLGLHYEKFHTSACVEFKNFFLYDTNFKNALHHNFVGILLVLKNGKFKASLHGIDENILFEKLNSTGFDTQRIVVKNQFALIASLTNPFFINPKLSLSENVEKMKENLAKIEKLFE